MAPAAGLDAMPLATTLGMRLIAATAEEVRTELDWAERLCTASGVLHGGTVMAMADTTAALCAYLNLPDDAAGTTTVESKTNFLRGVREGTVTAVSLPVHVGRTIITVETSLTDRSGRLVGRTSQSQLVLRR